MVVQKKIITFLPNQDDMGFNGKHFEEFEFIVAREFGITGTVGSVHKFITETGG